MKKLMIAIGVLVGLFVAAAVIIPLVVDVDKYRPQIVEAANQQINGSLELGKLSLSLWGQIRIEVGGVKVKDSSGKELVGVKDAYFHLPFLPLLSGSPVITFKMNQPLVSVVKNKAGKMNLLSLVKESPKTGTAATTPAAPVATPAPATKSAPAALPGIATRARLGFELRNALVTYKDEASGLSTDIKDLNFILQDVSLSHPTSIELWADLDTRLGKTFLLKGPARLTGKAQPTLKDGKIDSVSLSAKFDMNDVEMAAPGTFEKKKGMATEVELDVTGSEKELKIAKFLAKFFNAEITVKGNVTQLDASSPVVNVQVNSNEIQFKPWVELVPMLKEFELGGSAKLDANASGPSEKLFYRAKLAFNNLTAKAPKLKAQPKLDGAISIVPDQIESLWVTMKAPGNDLKIQGKLVSFSKPNANFQVTSSGMDLDQLIVFPPPAEKSKAASSGSGSASTSTASKSAAPAQDLDALLDPVRENKMLAGMVANLSIDIKMLKATGVKINDIICRMSFKDLVAGIDQFGMKIFSGSIKADAHLQMKPKMPTYQFNAQVAGLDIAQAVESQMAMFKNTVTGKANFSMNAQGASFNTDPAISRLNAKGNFKVDQAVFATVDVSKMVSEGLGKSLNQLGDKVPALKGKTLGSLPSGGSKYEFISSDFAIIGGKFSAPNFYAKSMPNQGIDLKGVTEVGLKDNSLNTTWDVIDTYNLTKARDLSVEQNGVRVEHILAEGNSPFHFPVHAGCTTSAPCYSYTQVPEFLGKIALANIGNAVAGRAKEEAKKHAEEALKQAAPAIQNQLKGLFR